MSDWVHERNFRYRKFLFGFGVVYIIVMRPSRHTLRRYFWFVGKKTSPYRLYAEYRQFRRLALAPPNLETSGIYLDSKVRYPHIYAVCHRDRGGLLYVSVLSITWVGPWLEFSGDIFAIFVRIQNMFSPLNSANFCMSDRMGEMNFWSPSFSGLCCDCWILVG